MSWHMADSLSTTIRRWVDLMSIFLFTRPPRHLFIRRFISHRQTACIKSNGNLFIVSVWRNWNDSEPLRCWFLLSRLKIVVFACYSLIWWEYQTTTDTNLVACSGNSWSTTARLPLLNKRLGQCIGQYTALDNFQRWAVFGQAHFLGKQTL